MVRARFLSCTRGAAAAEMALILPLATLLLFTTLEAGHWMYTQHQVVKGLRDGARYAARQSIDDVDCAGISATVISEVQNLSTTGQLVNGGSPRVSGWDPSEVEVLVNCTRVDATVAQAGIYDSSEPGRSVIVRTRFDYDSLFNGLGILSDTTVDLNGEQEAAWMGI
nr:TadE/TadG family type IV pilus assembly protein [Altererythrobacter sp. BO-6]